MKTFFFTYRSNYIDLYLRFSTNELGWWAVANGPQLSPIFSVSLRELLRALRKKETKKKHETKQAQGRRQGKHRLSFLIFSSDPQSNGQGETRVDIRTDKCTRNNYKWEIGSLHVQVR